MIANINSWMKEDSCYSCAEDIVSKFDKNYQNETTDFLPIIWKKKEKEKVTIRKIVK